MEWMEQLDVLVVVAAAVAAHDRFVLVDHEAVLWRLEGTYQPLLLLLHRLL